MWSRVVWAGHCLNCRYFRVPRAPINDFAEKVEFTKSFDSFTQKLCGEKKNRTGKGKNRISMATKTIAEPLISCPNACSRAIIMRKKKNKSLIEHDRYGIVWDTLSKQPRGQRTIHIHSRSVWHGIFYCYFDGR